MTERVDGAAHRPNQVVDDYFAPSRSTVLPPAWTPDALQSVQTRRRTPNSRRLLSPRAFPAVVGIMAVLVVGMLQLRGGRAGALGHGDAVFGKATAHPPERAFPNPTRILPAPAVAAGTGGYTFLEQHGGSPVTWDPCQPIHYVVRPNGEIPGGQVMLDQAIAEISKETGLFFMDDGTTSEAPSTDRNPYQPDRYGQTWAPVLISWSDSNEYPALQGDVVGLGGPITVGGKDPRIVSGEVVFDASDMTQVEGAPQGATFDYDVMLHELGHLVGLGHIDDPGEVMNPVSLRPLAGYGPGDLRGLAVAGSGRCYSKG